MNEFNKTYNDTIFVQNCCDGYRDKTIIINLKFKYSPFKTKKKRLT